jgi:hypothetical protein
MTLDRAELAGTGAAILFHVALIAALSVGLARVARTPEPPSMEVDLVQDVSLQSAAPTSTPSVSEAPELSEAPPVEPVAAPVPQSVAVPAPPRPQPTPQVDAAELRARKIKAAKAAAATRAATAAAAKPASRASRLGADFLKGIGEAKSPAKQQASAPKFDARAQANIAQAILSQVQPCANKQVNPGPGADRIKVSIRLQLTRGGNLRAPPQIDVIGGVDDDNSRYVRRVKEMALNTFVGCAPLTGLPQALYAGGWDDFDMTYRLP